MMISDSFSVYFRCFFFFLKEAFVDEAIKVCLLMFSCIGLFSLSHFFFF